MEVDVTDNGPADDVAASAPGPVEVVQTFLGALQSGDVEQAVDLLAPDAIWHNVPFPPARGRETIARQLRGLDRYDMAFEVRMHNIAGDGPVVLTERTDILSVGPAGSEFWVCGTFEVHDGLITVWRDRFDFVDVLAGAFRHTLRGLWSAYGPDSQRSPAGS